MAAGAFQPRQLTPGSGSEVSDAGERSSTAHIARSGKGAVRQPAHCPEFGSQRQAASHSNLPTFALPPRRGREILGGGKVTATHATFTQRNETAEILRCLREALREPAFASALALVVSDGQQRECDIAGRVAPSASAANGEG